MGATLLIPPDVPYEEWKARRAELSRTAVTASEIAVILGISPWDSPFNLYWKKRGDIPADFDDDAMSLGRHLEPWIADRWHEDHPEFEVELAGLCASADRPWQMCTPDRLLFERFRCRSCYEGLPVPCECDERIPSLLEIKSSGSYDGWGEAGTDQIPAYYRAQVLWQLDVMGLGEAHVTCLFLGTRQRRDYVVAYDVTDVDLMRKAAQQFLARVEAGEAPDIDASEATHAALIALNPKIDDSAEAEVSEQLADDYASACADYKAAKEHKAELENRLRLAMGPAKYATCGGRKVATRSVYDVPEHTRKASHVDKLTPARTKDSSP